MNEDTINDLKQFIAATVTQQLSMQLSEFRQEMHEGFQQVNQKIDNLSGSVAEAIDTMNEQNEARFNNHEARLRRLEHQAT